MKPSQGDFPLKGVRILDLATVVAAPFSATLCGDMGAEVVKIELPQGGDPLRTLAPVDGDHALFWKVGNRGKKGITLDVRKPEGRQLFLKLIRSFDVLVENFRTGTLDGWGLDMPTLLQHNPQLIVLRLTGFGQTGPYAQRPGFARIFEAMSGLTYITGEPDRPPQHTNYPLGDAIAGLFGAFAIATALARPCFVCWTRWQLNGNSKAKRASAQDRVRLTQPHRMSFKQKMATGSRWWGRATRSLSGFAKPWTVRIC
jgi:crotonobetainyl-CoA:carnitine CoA-transferase CaiB-like acyl-CoA transferase